MRPDSSQTINTVPDGRTETRYAGSDERVKSSTSGFATISGLSYHVRSWGDPAAPALFLLHGWMDVGASFQFLVDALEREWHVIAPDWRGFGKSQWCAEGYWFPDYLADLDALLDRYLGDEPARLVGHSLGGNVACLYAGVRLERVSRVVSLEGFGIVSETADVAPAKLARWLEALRNPPRFRPYRDLAEVADRLQQNNPRLARDKAEFLASHWAELTPDNGAQLVSDPRHKLPFPTVYRMDEVVAVWRLVAAPVLWVAAGDSFVRGWLGDGDQGVEKRIATFRNARLETVADASHMLHHDRPQEVARIIESFLLE